MIFKSGLSALALLFTAQLAFAGDATKAPHWFDSIAGNKFTSIEGSTAQLSQGESGLSLEVAAPDGGTTDKIFEFMNDRLGSVYDAADKASPVGVFRQSDRGIEAEYADGHTEILSANTGGGLTIALTAPGTGLLCMKWYPKDHVYAESERKEALAVYASKLGLAAKAKPAASVSSCADTLAAPSRVAKAGKPGTPKPVLVRASDIHAIDADAMPAALVHPALTQMAMAPVAAPVADGEAQVVPVSAQSPEHGASSCLSIDSDGQNWGFRNACDQSVQFAYCLQNGADRATACGSGTATGGVAKNGFFALIASSAVIDDDHQFRWVACSGDAGTVTPQLDRAEPPAGRCIRSQDS